MENPIQMCIAVRCIPFEDDSRSHRYFNGKAMRKRTLHDIFVNKSDSACIV